MYKTIFAVAICCALFSSSALGDMLDDYDAQKEANYAKYMGLIKGFIPSGWSYGDVIEAPLRNENDVQVSSLVLLTFHQESRKGKINIIQKSGDSFVKKWESTETIIAEDGVIGDMEDIRYPADINKDGFEEAVVTFSSAKLPSQGLVEMWIYRWDGSKGTLISPMSETYSKRSGFIGSQMQPPALIDEDNDGIYEVFAQDNKIYKWVNGKYVYWKDQHLAD